MPKFLFEKQWHTVCTKSSEPKIHFMNNIIRKANGGGTLPSTSFSGLVDQLFENNLSRIFDDRLWGFNGKVSTSNVPVNIRETDKAYELEMVAPGYRKEDFRVDVSGELLTVSLHHGTENRQEDKTAGIIRQEYRRESFSRSFNLDDTIDANKISARYQDGLLHLDLPKKEGSQKISKTINID